MSLPAPLAALEAAIVAQGVPLDELSGLRVGWISGAPSMKIEAWHARRDGDIWEDLHSHRWEQPVSD